MAPGLLDKLNIFTFANEMSCHSVPSAFDRNKGLETIINHLSQAPRIPSVPTTYQNLLAYRELASVANKYIMRTSSLVLDNTFFH